MPSSPKPAQLDGRADSLGEPDRPKCDFCGEEVSAVRRVALDQEYDRLQKAHRELYSCAPCFDNKEEERLGLAARR